MAKIQVTNPNQDSEVPFLRGILTRSLVAAGLEFEDAYDIASEVRDGLSDKPTITTRDLRANVLRHLRGAKLSTTAQQYKALRENASPVLIEDEAGNLWPFSRTKHQRSVEACGMDSDHAAAVTRMVYAALLQRQKPAISTRRLGRFTYNTLKTEIGNTVARRYLAWVDFERSGRPLILLIGGTAGSGKSTVSTALANRLDIVRTQSTDMLREVMRLMMPERLLPVLHQSSFLAWRALPGENGGKVYSDSALTDGFQAQAELLTVAGEAVVQRASRERVSLVLEGVHVQPSFSVSLPEDTDAVVVRLMTAVLKAEDLQRRIHGRGSKTPGRRATRYLENFDAIWRLQTFLLSEADRLGIPIVKNDDKETVIQDVMRIIIDRLECEFTASSEEVFARKSDQPQ